jgi:hypothetical protein
MTKTQQRTLQRQDAMAKGNVRRLAIREMRRDLKEGRLDLIDVLRDPPELLQTMPIIDAVRVARNVSPRAAPNWLVRMGRDATFAQINLLLPLGAASERTRGLGCRVRRLPAAR